MLTESLLSPCGLRVMVLVSYFSLTWGAEVFAISVLLFSDQNLSFPGVIKNALCGGMTCLSDTFEKSRQAKLLKMPHFCNSSVIFGYSSAYHMTVLYSKCVCVLMSCIFAWTWMLLDVTSVTFLKMFLVKLLSCSVQVWQWHCAIREQVCAVWDAGVADYPSTSVTNFSLWL